MKLVRPLTITDSLLTDSNVLETPPAAYAGGTTYALGDQVSVFSGVNSTTATMYESLQAGNTGNTPASSPLWWQAIGTAYLAYNAGTSYSTGAVVTDTTNHLLYESLTNGNLGNALTSTAYWLELGPSNKWAAFDSKSGTQSSRPLEVMFEVTPTTLVNSIGLLNLSGYSVTITSYDGATELYNETFSLVSSDGVTDWYGYFFEEITYKTDLFVDGLPNVLGAVLTVTVAASATASIGAAIFGTSRELGGTLYGASVGIRDYSRATEDDFGNWYFVQRGYAKKGQFTVWVDAAETDAVFNILSSYRATPVLVVGADDYTSSYLFGIFKDWRVALAYPSHSILDLEFQGI